MDRRTFLASLSALGTAACGGSAPLPSMEATRTKWPPLGRFIHVDGLRIHGWEQGTGSPIVLLHGASGNLRDFTFDLGPRLAETGRRVVAFDRPGLGYSERPVTRGGDPAVQARVLRKAALKMGVERPILVGHSWGAALAMAWALGDPDGVAGIVTVSGAVMPWSDRPMLAEMIGLDQLLIGFYFNYLQSSAGEGGIERFVERIFRPQTPPDGYADYVGGPLALRPSVLEANKQDIASLNTALRRQAPDYHRIKAPVEIISGTADFIIKPDRQPIPFAERLANSRLTLLDGVGHMAHHIAPDQLVAALDRIEAQA